MMISPTYVPSSKCVKSRKMTYSCNHDLMKKTTIAIFCIRKNKKFQKKYAFSQKAAFLLNSWLGDPWINRALVAGPTGSASNHTPSTLVLNQPDSRTPFDPSCSQPLPPPLFQVLLSGARSAHAQYLPDTPLHAHHLMGWNSLLHYFSCLSLGPDQRMHNCYQTHLFMQSASSSSIIPGASLWGQICTCAMAPRHTSSRPSPDGLKLSPPLFQLPLSGSRSAYAQLLPDTPLHAVSLFLLHYSRCFSLGPDLHMRNISQTHLFTPITWWAETLSSIISAASLWVQISVCAMATRHASSRSQPPPPPLFQVPLPGARLAHARWLRDTPPHAASLSLLHYSRCLSLGPDQPMGNGSQTHLFTQWLPDTSLYASQLNYKAIFNSTPQWKIDEYGDKWPWKSVSWTDLFTPVNWTAETLNHTLILLTSKKKWWVLW